MAAALLALGLDPERCTLFVQSHRPEVTELAWLLATVTPVSWLERTPTYKEKKRDQPDDINHGLLTYPVLQAADIVIYKASLVPVGKDQAAHLELSREIVRAFNNRYGDTFPEPQAVYTEAPVVLGTDGVRKMSKSLGNTIDILAPPGDVIPQAGHVDGHRHEADPAHRPRAARRSATSASSTASSATTTRRSGTASGRPGPAASTRRSCWPTGSSPTTPRPASATRADGRPGRVDEILAGGRRSDPPDRRGDDGRGPREDGPALIRHAERPPGPRDRRLLSVLLILLVVAVLRPRSSASCRACSSSSATSS